jgi:hypothetical protein
VILSAAKNLWHPVMEESFVPFKMTESGGNLLIILNPEIFHIFMQETDFFRKNRFSGTNEGNV